MPDMRKRMCEESHIYVQEVEANHESEQADQEGGRQEEIRHETSWNIRDRTRTQTPASQTAAIIHTIQETTKQRRIQTNFDGEDKRKE